jgi:micrococcal nuclease
MSNVRSTVKRFGAVVVLLAAILAMPLQTIAAPLDGYTLPDDVVEARFVRVVDGDTFHAEVQINGEWQDETIRLIGIDTPETTDAFGNHPECYGEEAKRYADSILNAAPHIWLETDKDPEDNYDRQLRYVWYEDPASGNIFLLNEELVWDGYALAKTYRPNTTRQDILDAAEDHAISESNGMWMACDRTVTGDPDAESGEDFPTMNDPTPTESGTIEEDVFCAVFDSYQDAQDFLAAYPQIADDIDIDGDGIACEDWFPS